MEEPAELDDPEPREASLVGINPEKTAARHARLAALDAEAANWLSDPPDLVRLRLSELLSKGALVSPEVLVRLCGQAQRQGDTRTLNLAFEILSKQETGRLYHQAWGQVREEREQQVQDVLMRLFEAIRNGTSGYAETNFAGWAKRRAVDLHRTRKARFERAATRVQPTDDVDPLDELAAPGLSAEDKATILQALDKLPPKHRAVFIQIHQLGMTQPEVAQHHGVVVKTVYNWLRECADILSNSGDQDAR